MPLADQSITKMRANKARPTRHQYAFCRHNNDKTLAPGARVVQRLSPPSLRLAPLSLREKGGIDWRTLYLIAISLFTK